MTSMTIFCRDSGLVLNASTSSSGIEISQKARLYNICRQVNRFLPASLVMSQYRQCPAFRSMPNAANRHHALS